jgi:hypothetical protein
LAASPNSRPHLRRRTPLPINLPKANQYQVSQYLVNQYLVNQYLVNQYLVNQYLVNQYRIRPRLINRRRQLAHSHL